jgi:LysR family glycine cleavage system transcriptional activator
MPKLPPTRGLRAFCVAADCLSFKKASEQLYLTPSAISHQIKQLEEQLGLILFKRQTRAIELTRVGRQFYQSIQPIINELESTIANFTHSQESPSITISLPEFLASELFVPRLAQWTKLNPDINLKLETVKSSEQSSKPSNLSIVLSGSAPNKGIIHDLFPIRYVAACNKSIHEKWATRGVDALHRVPLIVHQSRQWSWHQWAERNGIKDFNPRKIIQFDSMFGVVRAAQQGIGIAMAPMPISENWFKEGQLLKLFDDELVTKDRYYLVHQQNNENQLEISILADWIIENFQNLT